MCIIRVTRVTKKIISIRLRKISRLGILISGISTVVLLLVSFYGLSVGNFVIQIEDTRLTEKGISLSTNADFTNPTTRLETVALQNATNITYTDIPADVGNTDDSNNDPGGNYFAFSFYIKNSGNDPINYSGDITIDSVTKKVDSAIRVMTVKNYDEKQVYAKAQETAENLGQPEPDTIPFYNDTIIFYEKVLDFKVNEIARYTIVIWLEGNDPECVDDILGGGIKMSMNFNVLD